jgi:hypothetical protein
MLIIAGLALGFAGLVFIGLIACLVIQCRTARGLDVLKDYRDDDENRRWGIVWEWATKQSGPKRRKGVDVRPIDDRAKKKPRKTPAAHRPVGQEWQMEFGDIRDKAEDSPTESSESEPPPPVATPVSEPEPPIVTISEPPPAPVTPGRSDARLMKDVSETLSRRKQGARAVESDSDSSSESPVLKPARPRFALRPLPRIARPKLFSSDDSGPEDAGNGRSSGARQPAGANSSSSSSGESM